MTDAARKVLTGFVRLSPSDRSEVTDAMNHFLAGPPAEQSRLRKEYEGTVMGPGGLQLSLLQPLRSAAIAGPCDSMVGEQLRGHAADPAGSYC